MVLAAAVFAVAAVGAQNVTTDHPGQYDRTDIETGSRLYTAQCAGCHGATGDMVNGVDLRRGRFITARSDEDLVRVLANGRPASGMPSFATLPPTDVTGLIAFIRAGFDRDGVAVRVGDPARGQALFDGKGACATCHRVNGRGSHAASDLSDIGATRSPGSLQRALTNPSTFILPANRSVRAVLRDGRTIQGRRLNEDTYSIQILNDRQQLVSVSKADIKSLELPNTSAMPSVAMTMSATEVSDLVAYLLSLKGL